METMREKIERLMKERQDKNQKKSLLSEMEQIKGIMSGKKSNNKMKSKDNLVSTVEKILENCLVEIMNEYDNLFKHLEDPERVHQVRVKIRKMRAGLAFFMPLFEPEKYQIQQERLGEMGQSFGLVRQLDVILDEIAIIEKDNIIPISEFGYLKNKLTEKRAEAFSNLTDCLMGDQGALEILEIWIWLLNQPWGEDASLFNWSIKDYTDKRLAIWMKKIDKTMKNINMEHQKEIHKVRIKSKKMRYVIEQLAPILDKKTRKSGNEFEKIQDDLGYFHDVFANKILLEQLINASDENQLHYEAGIIVGWQIMEGNRKIAKYLK